MLNLWCSLLKLIFKTNTKSTFNCLVWNLCHGDCMKSVSCPGSYCGLALGCGHWPALEALEGQAGLADPSLLGVLVDHGGLRGGRNMTALW